MAHATVSTVHVELPIQAPHDPECQTGSINLKEICVQLAQHLQCTVYIHTNKT